MNRIITTLFVLFGVTSSIAQFSENHAIYTTGELNIGNYVGVDLNLNYVFKETYSFKIGYTGNLRKPKSLPDNYSSGLTGLLSFGLANPYDQFENYQIGLGRIYNLNKKRTIRANLSLGLGFTTIKEPENWVYKSGAFLVENYTWNYRKHHTVSLIINPKIEFPFTRYYGLTLSPMLQINKDRTYFGIGIGNMIGLLKKRSNKKKNKPLD